MGIARQVINAWMGVSGVARKFWPPTRLSELSVGSRVLYNSKYYTLIAKNYAVSGDVILWEETASFVHDGTTTAPLTTNATPFGTTYTNKATITKQSGTSSSSTVTNYGWSLPMRALGYNTSYGSPAMSYFSSDAKRIRATAYYALDTKSGGITMYTRVTTSGGITYGTINRTSCDCYYAYSVKGTTYCYANSDGSYTLTI